MKYFMRLFYDSKHKLPPLKTAAIVLSLVVVCTQIGLGTDKFRSYLTAIDIVDGTVAVNADYEPQIGTVKLVLTDGEPSENIKVLVNGEEYCNFDEREKVIEIKMQSVIEVLNDSQKNIAVTTDSFSDNITATLNNGNVVVEDIAVLSRVVFK